MVRGNLVSTDGTFARTQDVEGRPTFLSTARDNMNWPKGDSFRLAATSLGARNAVGYDNATLPGKAPTARGATDLWGTTIPEKSGFAIGADVAPGKAASATPRYLGQSRPNRRYKLPSYHGGTPSRSTSSRHNMCQPSCGLRKPTGNTSPIPIPSRPAADVSSPPSRRATARAPSS